MHLSAEKNQELNQLEDKIEKLTAFLDAYCDVQDWVEYNGLVYDIHTKIMSIEEQRDEILGISWHTDNFNYSWAYS